MKVNEQVKGKVIEIEQRLERDQVTRASTEMKMQVEAEDR